ncbi:MAG: hypothetical protein AB1921_12705, partial [Thermodesulfobacteriota bacterium]
MSGNATTWTYDVGDGVLKNRALSTKLLMEAAKKFHFVQFTQKVEGFGKKQGQTVTLSSIQDLAVPTNNGLLNESTRIPVDKLVLGTNSITLVEWGRAVEFTNLMEDLIFFDMQKTAQKA